MISQLTVLPADAGGLLALLVGLGLLVLFGFLGLELWLVRQNYLLTIRASQIRGGSDLHHDSQAEVAYSSARAVHE